MAFQSKLINQSIKWGVTVCVNIFIWQILPHKKIPIWSCWLVFLFFCVLFFFSSTTRTDTNVCHQSLARNGILYETYLLGHGGCRYCFVKWFWFRIFFVVVALSVSSWNVCLSPRAAAFFSYSIWSAGKLLNGEIISWVKELNCKLFYVVESNRGSKFSCLFKCKINQQ